MKVKNCKQTWTKWCPKFSNKLIVHNCIPNILIRWQWDHHPLHSRKPNTVSNPNLFNFHKLCKFIKKSKRSRHKLFIKEVSSIQEDVSKEDVPEQKGLISISETHQELWRHLVYEDAEKKNQKFSDSTIQLKLEFHQPYHPHPNCEQIYHWEPEKVSMKQPSWKHKSITNKTNENQKQEFERKRMKKGVKSLLFQDRDRILSFFHGWSWAKDEAMRDPKLVLIFLSINRRMVVTRSSSEGGRRRRGRRGGWEGDKARGLGRWRAHRRSAHSGGHWPGGSAECATSPHWCWASRKWVDYFVSITS